MSDPDSNVRNNAMRALSILAEYAGHHPELRLKIPAEPFIKMLNSLVWTDRDKAGFALMRLTERRDPAMLDSLRGSALPSLVEMAQWKTPGHANMFCLILGRIAGMPDHETWSDVQSGEKDQIIAAALKTETARRSHP
jgi:hypothetical protein